MSRLTQFHLYDQALIERLVRSHRRAPTDREAITALLLSTSEPKFPTARSRLLRQQLDRFRELNAPEIVIENCRRELEPRAFLLERLASEAVSESDLLDLALRSKTEIPANYDCCAWLADDEARRRDPTPDMSELWIQPFASPNAAVREALYGNAALAVDGSDVLGGQRNWVHGVDALPRVRSFFEQLLGRPPPALDDYRRWYLHLHATKMNLIAPVVPDEAALTWEYADDLSSSARTIRRVISMLRNCERRKWCVQVCWE